jgi:hypothetical protein
MKAFIKSNVNLINLQKKAAETRERSGTLDNQKNAKPS